MIRVSVLYPGGEGTRFDHDYYREKHLPLAGRRLTPFGLLRYEIDRGIGGMAPGSSAPYVAACHFYFTSPDEFGRGMAEHGGEIVGDIPNYTNAAPVVQVSEIVE